MQIPPPAFLPKLHSKKWHNRKLFDPIGYLRVQHLAGDHADADWPHILHSLRSIERKRQSMYKTDQRPLREARRILKGMSQATRNASQTEAEFADQLEESWAKALEIIDRFLEAEREVRMTAVREAGASGI